MDEKKDQEPVYLTEVADTTALDTPAEVKETGEVSRDPRTDEIPNQGPRELTPWPEPVVQVPPPPMEGFLEFLKRTKHIWLIVAGVIFGLMAAVTVAKRISEKMRIAREERHETAAVTISPDHLLARCGPPVQDLTKEMYPLVTRTMSYATASNGAIVFAFSKTSEASSEWVFLSMKDASGGRTYDTPEEKVAAMSCLDSQK